MLAGLDPSTAVGPETNKPVVLRSLKDQVAPILQIILQQSLNTGQISSDWKKAIVTPLFKKGDKCDPATTTTTYYTNYNMVLGSEGPAKPI